MSRVGKKPITIPSGVTVNISDTQLEVKGPKGTLSTPVPSGIKFTQEEGTLTAERNVGFGTTLTVTLPTQPDGVP